MQKVLICDDSVVDLIRLRNIVEEVGILTITALNGREALEKAKAEQPDLIFLDIIMPEMDGFETCRKLRDHPETRHIPVIFVTSLKREANRLWAQMQGAKGLISKPYQPDQILEKIRVFMLHTAAAFRVGANHAKNTRL